MKISKCILSYEQMQQLKALGVGAKNTAISLVEVNNVNVEMPTWLCSRNAKVTPTLTFQEILNMLPKEIKFPTFKDRGWLYVDFGDNTIGYKDAFDNEFSFNCSNLMDGAFKLLQWIVKNRLLKR